MTDALDWIDARRPPSPPSLRAAIARALERAAVMEPAPGARGARRVEEQLAAGALATLRVVVEGPGDRSTAADLLAADALLTYACEAAAERSPAALEALAATLSPAALAGLLEPTAP